MTQTTRVLELVWLVVLTTTIAGLWRYLFSHTDGIATVALRTYTADLDRDLRFLRSKVRGVHIVGVQAAAVVGGIVLSLVLERWLLLLLVPAVVVGPKVVVRRNISKRVTRLEEQIEPWLNAIANALKANPSLGEALESSLSLVASPMSDEVRLLLNEYYLGTPLDQAFDQLADRVGARTLSGALLALKVARRSGGNLPEMLENAATALRELARLEGVVRSKTAEGKAQTLVIGVVPVPLVLGINAVDPRYFAPLAETFVGNLVLGGAAVLWAIAILAAHKILAVDV